ncbi:FAD binding domain-containing protein [Labrys sp. LIt4]|uniref:FAD binding domain-containing protein n=1 Tax=Labrys sp. LIt4 TaxID=2821355 RepID=UPI001AE04DAB|nr:FAD binding domain-containing protein [Labrys sp. LIt4]MBP0577926.1 FAD binding domain-containing protein [Labrys sp. LIt4]
MYLRPRTVDEACEALAAEPMRILAGGTDIFPALGDRPLTGAVLDLSAIDGLSGIEFGADVIRIGARTTWSAIAGAALPPALHALQQAAREVGAIQIQNAGTIAGNLCNASPAADGVPPLLALDARVELRSTKGGRELTLGDFITGYRRTARRPDELVSAILVPRSIETGRSAFLKLGARKYLVISIAMVAVIIACDDEGTISQARIAVGACSEIARRLTGLEATLIGAKAEPGLGVLIRPEHLAGLAPIDDVRASAEYRRDAVKTLIARTLDAALQQSVS